MSSSTETETSKYRKGVRLAISLLFAAFANFIADILSVAAVVLISVLALYFRHIGDVLLIILIATCLLFIVLWRNERRRNPLRKTYPDEATAIESSGGIRKWLESLPMYSEIKLIGVCGSSIFWLFDVYVQLMSNGCTIEILSLDYKATDLIDFLAENEPEESSRGLVDKLFTRLEEMQTCQICPDLAAAQEVRLLLEEARKTRSNREIRLLVFESCARLWLHARDKAMRLHNLKHSPLKLKYYNQIPYLKVWTTFPPTLCYRGSYITQPNIGMSNPIEVLNPNKSNHDRIVVEKIIDTMKLLLEHKNTRRVNSLNDIHK